MPEVFDFNHIDPNMDEKIKNELKDYYKYYHKVWWCYKKTFQRYKKIHLGIYSISYNRDNRGGNNFKSNNPGNYHRCWAYLKNN